MKGRDVGLLLVLGAMWGSSFLFIKVAVGEVSPQFIVACRLLFALLTLLAAVPILARVSGGIGGGGVGARAVKLWKPLLLLGVCNAALPYFVISWGTQFMPSGTAAILNSTVPLFTALLAGVMPAITDESLGPLGVAGILLGILGVGVLAGGFGNLSGVETSDALLGAGAVLAGSLSYAAGGLYARRAMKGVPVIVSSLGQNAVGFLVILPVALLSLPDAVPSLSALGSLVALGAVGTGISLLLYFKLIANVGATRTSTVTYLVPVWALLYGALLLGEEVTLRAILGLVLILAGVAGVTGIVRLPRKRPPAVP